MQPGTLPIPALLAAMLLLCAACDTQQEPGKSSVESAGSPTLRRGNGGEPGSLDPARAEDIHAYNVLIDLFEGLVAHNAAGEIEPAAAERWTVSPDGLEYRFYLRTDARWSNGEPLLAGHFVDGIRQVVRPGTLSSNAFLLESLAHFDEVLRGELPQSELGVWAEDDRTVVFRLQNPTAYFPGILTMPVAFPRLASIHRDTSSFRDPERFVGNGAYVLDEWRVGSFIRLRRNPAHRLFDTTAIEFVEYFSIENPATEFNRYRTGELDMTATIPPAVFATVSEERPQEVHISPGLAVYYLAFDLSEPPMSSLQLRKALSLAIDRIALVRVLGRGEHPAFNLVPPRVSNHLPAEYAWKSLEPGDRIAAAREAYDAAGYGSENPLAITLTYDAGDIHEKVALVVSSMWRDVLGVDVSLNKLEWKIFLDNRENRSSWQIMRFSWFGDYDDASTFTNIFQSDSPQNLPGYRSSQYDASLRLADQLNDPIERRKLMSDAEQILLEDYPIVPLYFYVNKHLVNPAVRGFESNILDRHPTRTLTLERAE